MKAADIKMNLVDSFFFLLKNLSSNHKLELIARLSKSMKTSNKAKKASLRSLYGSWVSDQSADELIDELKKARNFDREREKL